MRRSDITRIDELTKSSFDPRLEPYMTSAQEGAGQFLEAFVRHSKFLPDRSYIVARSVDHEVMGYADFRLTGATTSFLSYIAVAPEARGLGVASALIDDFLDRNQSIKSIELDVFAVNGAARALYDKRGFTVVDSSDWWVRDIPQAPATVPRDWVIKNVASSVAWQKAFGFCEYEVETEESARRFGQIGRRTLRCFSAEEFSDDRFLGAAASIASGVKEAFLVQREALGPPTPDCRKVNTSLRMIWSAPSCTDHGRCVSGRHGGLT